MEFVKLVLVFLLAAGIGISLVRVFYSLREVLLRWFSSSRRLRLWPVSAVRLAVSLVLLVTLVWVLALCGGWLLERASPHIAYSRFVLGQAFTWGAIFGVLSLGAVQQYLASRSLKR